MSARFFKPQELQQWVKEDPERLLAAALTQIDQLRQRAQQLKEARARIAVLEKALEEAQKAACRQAAPFRVPPPKRVANPKRPGRKAGHPGSFRPRPSYIDEEITVKLGSCKHCGAQEWAEQEEVEQFIEDIPRTRPHVTHLRTFVGTCACCGESTRSRHPLQVSEAAGAAACHIGPQALAIAADLNKAKGIPMRKTCAVLKDHFDLKITPGGLSGLLARVALKVEPQYLQIQEDMLKVPALYVDETSWWVAGSLYWLWVFTHPKGTFYHVDKSRGRCVLETILGEVFPGVLVSDCLSIYDLEEGEQHKCFSHHLNAIRKAKEAHPLKGEGFLTQIGELLRRAIALGKEKAALPAPEFLQRLHQLETEVDTMLAAPREEKNEESVRNRLLKQRDHLFTFLKHDGVDATNNLAERQLRPAVIARKISCGNKTEAGAGTFQILASIAATCAQTGCNFINLIAKAMPLNSS